MESNIVFDFVEPNDTILEATDIGLTLSNSGNFIADGFIGDSPNITNGSNDVDLFQIQLNIGDRVTIDIDAREFGSNLDSVLLLFDSNGTLVAFSDDDFAPGENPFVSFTDSFISFEAEISGLYYIGVSSFPNLYDPFVADSGTGGNSTGEYNIDINLFNGIEPNDAIFEATDTGLTSSNPGNFIADGFIGDSLFNPEIETLDVDLFEVQLNAGDYLTVDIDTTESDSSLDSVLRLFDSNGLELVASDDTLAPDENPFATNVGDSFISFQAEASGIYYIGVSSFPNINYDPRFSNTLSSDDSGNSTGEYTIDINLFKDDNDTIFEAQDTGLTSINPGNFVSDGFIGINDIVTDGIIGRNNEFFDAADDIDFFEVQLNAGDVITIDIDAQEFGSSLDSVLRLFDSNGNQVAISDDNNAPGENPAATIGDSFISFEAEASGIYYIGVSSFFNLNYNPFGSFRTRAANGNSIGEYKISITLSTPDNDILDGTMASNSILGLDGNDLIQELAGNNTLNGDDGADRFFGQGGNDVLRGAAGNDSLNGGGGNDTLLGGTANDVLRGGTGRDRLNGGRGNDTLIGGSANDVLRGGTGSDSLNGGRGNDTLIGGSANDVLRGGTGSDIFVFDTGSVFDISDLGVDRILDFSGNSDRINLSKDTFAALDNTNNGPLRNSDFEVVTSNALAKGSSAEIVYNSSNGNLYYNENNAAAGFGNGGLFAKLIGSPDDLSARDFVVVDV
ncbi:MAG: DVUA0089 family protein [Xenococcaceae cyanobacterium MO_167.B27]|nr:DVUA0089 family protein [Xenococcaceae cyanobacterium MO_167.B27]